MYIWEYCPYIYGEVMACIYMGVGNGMCIYGSIYGSNGMYIWE